MLQKSTTEEILAVFFKEPRKQHYLKEISRQTNIAHTSVQNVLQRLLKENVIKKQEEQRGSRIFPIYSANFQENHHKILKRLHNIEELYRSGLIDYLIKETTPRCIILFGSYAKGEDIETSDVDIFIEAEETRLRLDRFEKQLQRKIQLHMNEEFTSYPKELKNNMVNGILLFGYLEAY